MQNFARSEFSAPHFEQRIGDPPKWLTRRSTLNSFRGASQGSTAPLEKRGAAYFGSANLPKSPPSALAQFHIETGSARKRLITRIWAWERLKSPVVIIRSGRPGRRKVGPTSLKRWSAAKNAD